MASDPNWTVRQPNPQYPPPLPRSRELGLGFVVMFSFLVSLIGAGLLLLVLDVVRGDARKNASHEPVTVPELTDLTFADARAKALDLGIALHVVGARPEGSLDAAPLLDQSILPGSVVARWTVVEAHLVAPTPPPAVVAVAATPVAPRFAAEPDPDGGPAPGETAAAPAEEVGVPSVVGLKVPAASRALKAAGLAVGEISEVPAEGDDVVVGSVVSQEPASGALLAAGGAVALRVARGKASVEVPSTARLPASEARARLDEAGLKARVLERFSPSVPKGHVILTKPAAGSEVEPGAWVEVYVAE
ncbi:MAG: PASTA domain-containing protein [Myxococcales bacterium]|nr:PASTA domain-containing protein [Myxococcales bacterium]MCB9732615.1 PASTA domain-containing protein [Deltaproteobacteria bacterium]